MNPVSTKSAEDPAREHGAVQVAMGARRWLQTLGAAVETMAERFADYRRIYELLLGDAAVLLALATKGNNHAALLAAVTSHERRWGHTRLIDDAYREPGAIWQQLRRSIDKGVT